MVSSVHDGEVFMSSSSNGGDDDHQVMKQFESPGPTVTTPGQLDFKIMKETVEDASRDTQNNGELRLTPPDNFEVQNGSKKLLEIVNLNSSRVVCDSSSLKDIGRISSGSSSVSEKENVVMTNGLTHELESASSAHPENDSEKPASRTEKSGESSLDLLSSESAEARILNLFDNPEENSGNESTSQAPGPAVSEEGHLKSIDGVSKLTNGPLTSDANLNGDLDPISDDELFDDEEQPVSSTDMPPASSTLNPSCDESSLVQKQRDPDDRDCKSLGSDGCDDTTQSSSATVPPEELDVPSAALSSKDVQGGDLDSSSTPLDETAILPKTLSATDDLEKINSDSLGVLSIEDEAEPDSLQEPCEDKKVEGGDLDSSSTPLGETAILPKTLSVADELEKIDTDSLSVLSIEDGPEPDSLQEPCEDKKIESCKESKKESEPDSLEGIDQHVPKERGEVVEPDSLNEPSAEVIQPEDVPQDGCEPDNCKEEALGSCEKSGDKDQVSHSMTEDASELDLLEDHADEKDQVSCSMAEEAVLQEPHAEEKDQVSCSVAEGSLQESSDHEKDQVSCSIAEDSVKLKSLQSSPNYEKDNVTGSLPEVTSESDVLLRPSTEEKDQVSCSNSEDTSVDMLLQQSAEVKDQVSCSVAKDAGESESLKGPPNEDELNTVAEPMDLEEHLSDGEIDTADEVMDIDDLVGSPDDKHSKDLGSLNEAKDANDLEKTSKQSNLSREDTSQQAEADSVSDRGVEQTKSSADAETKFPVKLIEDEVSSPSDTTIQGELPVNLKEVSNISGESLKVNKLCPKLEEKIESNTAAEEKPSSSDESLKNLELQPSDEVKDLKEQSSCGVVVKQSGLQSSEELKEVCDSSMDAALEEEDDEDEGDGDDCDDDDDDDDDDDNDDFDDGIDDDDDDDSSSDAALKLGDHPAAVTGSKDDRKLGEDLISGNSVAKSCETSSEKSNSFSKISYRHFSSSKLSLTSSGRDNNDTETASFGKDFEDDLRAMEESMWLDDIGKSSTKISSKSSTSENCASASDTHSSAEPREERLRRKRSSEDEGLSEASKRTKISTTSGEDDSDFSSEASRDFDIASKRACDSDAGDRQVKKVRTVEGVPEKPVYQSNLDKIIDQVATGVLTSENDGAEIELDDVADDDVGEVEKTAESSEPKTPKEVIPMPFIRKLSSNELKNLSRNDLEELVIQKLCEVVTERSNVGELRQRTQFLEQMVEQWRKKAQLLTKQMRDMEMVLKRFANDQKAKKDRIVLPVKITRSVGLQVHMGQPNQVGLSKTKPGLEQTRNPMRRKLEKSGPSSASSAVNSAAKTSTTSTSAPSTPQKVVSTVVTKPSSTGSLNSSPANSPTVKQVTTSVPIVKTVSTPIKTNTPRPAVVTSSVATSAASSVSSPVRSTASTTIPNRVVKSVTSPGLPLPIAPKPSQDLIDLTDEEDRAKGNTLRNALTVPADALIPATGGITSVMSSNAITTSVAGRGIRVVQQHQLTGGSTTTAAILTPTVTTSGQRLTYLLPTSSMPTQQRQLLLASTAQQVRAGSVMSMSGRPTIVFKSAPVVSMSQAGLPPGTMVQAGVPTSTSAILRPNSTLATLTSQQRPGQLRMPTASMVTSVGRMGTTVNTLVTTQTTMAVHPAPLPSLPPYGPTSLNLKLAPPKPELKISKVPTKNTQGIVLSWNMTLSSEHEEVASYQLYAYQEGNAAPSTSLWKKVGDVKALPLPMACTLTQFQEGHKYHFAVRAVDVHMRCGQFSAPGNIMLTRK